MLGMPHLQPLPNPGRALANTRYRRGCCITLPSVPAMLSCYARVALAHMAITLLNLVHQEKYLESCHNQVQHCTVNKMASEMLGTALGTRFY